jgi:tight adherence protein B
MTLLGRAAGVLLAGVLLVAAPWAHPAILAADGVSAEVIDVEGRDVTVALRRDIAGISGPLEVENVEATVAGQQIPVRLEASATSAGRPAVVLVLDVSGSMAGGSIVAARRAADAYVSSIPDSVDVALVTFADRPDVQALLGASDAEVRGILEDVRAEGSTSLFDAVSVGLSLVPEGVPGRLVVLSDGEDTASDASAAAVARTARDRRIAVDVLLLDPSPAQRSTAERLAVRGSVEGVEGANELVTKFLAVAGYATGATTLVMSMPPGLDAAGRVATISLTSGSAPVVTYVSLPDVASLNAVVLNASPVATPPTEEVSIAGEAEAPSAATSSSPALVVTAVATSFAAVALAGWVVMLMLARRSRDRRLAQLAWFGAAHARHVGGMPAGGRAPSLLERLNQALVSTRLGRSLQAHLVTAEIPLSPLAWLTLIVASCLPTVVLLWVILGQLWIAIVLTVGALPLLYTSILRARVTRRQRKFADELPEFLLLLSSALRAGLSFTQALESAASQQQGQVGRQIRRALAEAQVQGSLDEALLACAHRMRNDDLRWTVTALSVQREVGGNLSVILDTAASTIRSRHELAREVRTLSAEGKLSAYVLLALPVGVLIFLIVFRREYVEQLWTNPVGIVMLTILLALLLIGWVWMRSLVRIRV